MDDPNLNVPRYTGHTQSVPESKSARPMSVGRAVIHAFYLPADGRPRLFGRQGNLSRKASVRRLGCVYPRQSVAGLPVYLLSSITLRPDRNSQHLAQFDPIAMTGLDDPAQHIHVEFLVLVHGDVAEAGHAAQRFG